MIETWMIRNTGLLDLVPFYFTSRERPQHELRGHCASEQKKDYDSVSVTTINPLLLSQLTTGVIAIFSWPLVRLGKISPQLTIQQRSVFTYERLLKIMMLLTWSIYQEQQSLPTTTSSLRDVWELMSGRKPD